MNKDIIVIKIGGHELSSPDYIAMLAAAVHELQKQYACVLVHGGGKAISEWMEKSDVQPKFIGGQRVTDEKTLEIAEMVLSGQVNKTLVLALLNAGVDAIGMSGIDRGLIRVEPWAGEMDRVGRIVNVRTEVLLTLCADNAVPVISPISYGPSGKYNVNADHAAGAIGGVVSAKQVFFVTNVPGVKIDETLLKVVSKKNTDTLIASGKIFGGMIPKVQAAQAALNLGARAATITNLSGLSSSQGTMITTENGGPQWHN